MFDYYHARLLLGCQTEEEPGSSSVVKLTSPTSVSKHLSSPIILTSHVSITKVLLWEILPEIISRIKLIVSIVKSVSFWFSSPLLNVYIVFWICFPPASLWFLQLLFITPPTA